MDTESTDCNDIIIPVRRGYRLFEWNCGYTKSLNVANRCSAYRINELYRRVLLLALPAVPSYRT